jgi:hypothetical protein
MTVRNCWRRFIAIAPSTRPDPKENAELKGITSTPVTLPYWAAIPVFRKKDEMNYTCAICLGEFEEGWSDEEAREELRENFGAVSTKNCEIICDDCYRMYFLMTDIKEKYV